MSDYNLLGQDCNPVHTDNSLADTGQPTCASPQEYGQEASGKQEIQDSSTIPSLLPIATTVTAPSNTGNQGSKSNANNQGTSTAQKPLLYQESPRRRNSYYTQPHRRSWTDSRETYQNSAKREYELLLANHRPHANHFVTLKYFKEFTANEIRTTWSALKALLIQHGIVAYSVIEITTRPQQLPNGAWRNYPTNRVHYHFLVNSQLTEPRLRAIFNRSCIDAGLSRKDFEVQYASIPDHKTFKRKAKYILKFDNYKDQAFLFQPGTGVHKTCSIGRWFINPDGTKMNKDKTWKSIIAGWFQKTPKTP